MKKESKRFLAFLIMLVINSFVVAINFKAAIGLGPWDSFQNTISAVVNIRVGNIVMVLNSLLVVAQIFLMGKKFEKIQLLQLIVGFILGFIINFMLYDVLSFEINSYFIRFIMFFVSTVLIAFFIGAIMLLNMLTFPVEGFCKALNYRIGWDFIKIRHGLDAFCVAVSFVLYMLFPIPLIIREGTIITAIIYAPLMGLFMKLLKPYFLKWGLTD